MANRKMEPEAARNGMPRDVARRRPRGGGVLDMGTESRERAGRFERFFLALVFRRGA